MRISRAFLLVLAAVGAALLTGCQSVPVTGRSALNLVSDAEVTKMSIKAFEEMKGANRISRNRAHIDRVNRIGDRLAKVVFWDMPLAEWEFVVFEAPGVVNAFAMAGGKVGVFSGLIDLVENDDQLASVMAHEIAHVTARHVHERLSQNMLLQTGEVAAVLAASGLPGSSVAVSGVGSIYGVGAGISQLSFDRGKEKEADHIGLIYMARAGYDPREALKFLERMEGTVGGGSGAPVPPAWFSTHPAFPERMLQLIDLMPKALAEYEKSGVTSQPKLVR